MIGMLSASVSASTVRVPTTATRTSCTRNIVQRRSSRSARPPAIRPNSSIGICAATATPAISDGERVSVSAMSGTATAVIPSARFAVTDELQSFQKLAFSPPPRARTIISRSFGGEAAHDLTDDVEVLGPHRDIADAPAFASLEQRLDHLGRITHEVVRAARHLGLADATRARRR